MPKQQKLPILILSIRRVHVERIFDGTKLYELRKVLPKGNFSRVYLYESGGRGIVGCFDAGRPIKENISQLWDAVGERATARERFFEYFSKSQYGYAIPISNPIRFTTSICPPALREVTPKFTAPMSFLLLPPQSRLFVTLEKKRRLELKEVSVSLKPLKTKDETKFVSLVTREIAPKYDDITEGFARSILQSHEMGLDPNGIFTQKKRVLAIYAKSDQPVGFTTLTYKIGGCIKTGPTVLLPKYRQKGFASATRKALFQLAISEGIRKIYCTCPDNDPSVISYLLKSGLRIEAHLQKHYSASHGELVFGRLIRLGAKFHRTCVQRTSTAAALLDTKTIPQRNIVAFFRRIFRETWMPIKYSLAESIVIGANIQKTTYEEKPTAMICFGRSKKCSAIILLVPKRGGAVKALWLSATDHSRSLRFMLLHIEQMLQKIRKRKLYFVHPADDLKLIRILKESSYQTEGLLSEPYRKAQDAVVMSKLLPMGTASLINS